MGKLRSQEAQEAELRLESRRSDLRACGSAPVPHCSWRGRGRRGVSSVQMDGFGCTEGLGKGASAEEHTVPRQCAPTRTNPHVSTRKCVFSPCTHAHLSVPTHVPYTLGDSFTRVCMRHTHVRTCERAPACAHTHRQTHTRAHHTFVGTRACLVAGRGRTRELTCVCLRAHRHARVQTSGRLEFFA